MLGTQTYSPKQKYILLYEPKQKLEITDFSFNFLNAGSFKYVKLYIFQCILEEKYQKHKRLLSSLPNDPFLKQYYLNSVSW